MMVQKSLAKRLWYLGIRALCRLCAIQAFSFRVYQRHLIPDSGGVLVLSNHQSHLDPALVGSACSRPLNFVARKSLFSFRPFGWFIRSLNAFPIDSVGMRPSGIKETLRSLKRQEMVLLFPEGSRSYDGQVQPFKPGFCTLARRAKVALLPVAIDGAFDVWPRTAHLPKTGVIVMVFGAPILPREFAKYSDDELLATVATRIETCREQAAERRWWTLRGA